jgi:replicative DNA helicase
MLKPTLARDQLQARVARLAEGKRPGELTHIPTGFDGYDREFGGMELGCTTLAISHTGEGKSSLVRQVMMRAARAGVPCLDWSLEDPEARTHDRQLANETGIPSKRLNTFEVSKEELARLRSAADKTPKSYYLVHENPGLHGLLPATRDWIADVRRGGYDGPVLVGLDYVQKLIEGNNPEQELALLGSQLGDLMKDEGSSALVASQVRSEAVTEAKNRFAQSKPPATRPANWKDLVAHFRPRMADAEYCRRLEKSAKAVWVYWRPGRWARDHAGWEVADDCAELHVIKSNFGATGHSELGWDGPTQRIFQR